MFRLHHSHLDRRPDRCAFTLVELLTVLAVITVLAGILIPVVSGIRASARSTTCQSNLRQLGNALVLYSQDNKGLLPVRQNPSPEDPATLISWWQLIQLRLDMRFPTAGEDNIFMCPEANHAYTVPARRTYGLNFAGGSDTVAIRLNAIGKPGQSILLAETSQSGTAGDGYSSIAASSVTNGQLNWLHRGRTMNILYADQSLRPLPETTANLTELLTNIRK